jgi:hypothetical protein
MLSFLILIPAFPHSHDSAVSCFAVLARLEANVQVIGRWEERIALRSDLGPVHSCHSSTFPWESLDSWGLATGDKDFVLESGKDGDGDVLID